ncbi:hypothetical protein KKE60_02540 [Patescibacteria group bacterium]|nr:hypothetical protein [Patescibacteria group bacterium]MBU1066651.1 hypothetical protein [Patescibacteria group bacterium]
MEKLKVGRREYGLFGSKEVELEVDSHDRVRVTALRDTTLILKIHEENPDQEDVVDLNHPLVPIGSESGGNQEYKAIRLTKGSQLALYRTSFMVGNKTDRQIRWASSDDGFQDELFSEFCIKTLNEGGF